jgi:nitrogen fixation/metabolism regulation signal transduction histidine kinase
MVTPGVSGAPPRRLRWIATGQVVLWGAIGLGAFLLLAKSVQNSPEFGRLQLWILLFDVCGVIALSVLLARKLWRLVRDYRAHVPGSRLTARTVAIFGSLVIAPLLIVYLSSLEFINQGIDSWFKVEVKQGLSDAVGLSRAALDLRMREFATRTVTLAHALASTSPAEMQARLDAERRESQALEIVVFGAHARIIAASLENPLENLPSRPSPDLMRQVEEHLPYVSLEPQAGGRYLIRTAAALGGPGGHDERFVVATFPVPAQLAALSEAVQSTYSQYGDLAVLREPLKNSFRLTLTLVLLLSMLAAIYGAIYSAQRLVRPVQDLIEGTRAVGKGDFGTRLPLPSRDEMGFLVHSFNDMTKKLRRARAEATQSQQAVERERERLAIILARLSTGVLAIDRNMMVRTANAAAGAILGTDLSAATGRPLPELAATNERLGQFVAALAVRFAAGREEWREQLDLDGMSERDAEILERGTRTIVQQVETMQQMVNAFSEYARAPDMHVTRFNLNQLVSEVADLYRSQAPRTHIGLVLDQHIESIEADRGRVRQILNNLVTNALEALEGVESPLLEITTSLERSPEAAYAAVTVCDNGPGFQRELLGRVFDPYVTSKPKGTGLGLAIVKKIIEEHGGRIDADNRPEGGARVRVVLPVIDSTRSATGAARERRDQLRRERA